MDGFEFTVALLHELLWPLVTAGIAWHYKTSIVELLRRVTHFKAPGVEGTFAGRIEESDESTDVALDLAGVSITEVPEPIEPPISVEDPSGTILREWQSVQALLRTVLVENTGSDWGSKASTVSATRNGGTILKMLQHHQLIDPNTVVSARNLLDLRNQVAHGEYAPSSSEAFGYARTAEKLRGYLEYLLQHERTHGRGADE